MHDHKLKDDKSLFREHCNDHKHENRNLKSKY